jgi:hypothetical protein
MLMYNIVLKMADGTERTYRTGPGVSIFRCLQNALERGDFDVFTIASIIVEDADGS